MIIPRNGLYVHLILNHILHLTSKGHRIMMSFGSIIIIDIICGGNMELSLLLLKKIAVMLLMVLMGFAAVKAKLLKSEQSVVLSVINLYIATPCLIISSYQISYSPELMKGLVIAIIAAMLVHAVYILVSKPVSKLFRLDRIDRASLIYTNAGNLIVPLVSSMLPKEYVFFCSGYIAVQTILLWSHLPGMITDKFKFNLKKIVLNPNILAIAVGLICFTCRIELPMIISDTMDYMGASIGPICMVMIGMLMADVDLKAIFTDLHSYLVCFLRLIAFPVLIILIIFASRITALVPLSHDVLTVTVLAAAAPIGVSVAQMATLYNVDAKRAGALNVMTVLLCIITMPLIILVYQFLC